MVNKLQRVFKIKLKRRNFKTFLFFLLFSTVIWILVQFSKVYTKTVEIPLTYINEPLDKIILEENPDHIDIRMRDNGFSILYFRIFTPTLVVDLENTTQDENQLYYSIQENRNTIREQLSIDYDKSDILADTLAITYYQKMIKFVPVVSRIEVEFSVGYASANEIQLEPDSIQVSGHDRVIDTLQTLYTKRLRLEKVSTSVQGTVEIDKENLDDISLYTEEVAYFLEVEKFTEGRLTIPIEVINVPNDVSISIFPQEVIVIYQVNLNDFNQVGATDFRVVVDYKDVEKNKDFLIPKILAKPEIVKNIRLNEKKVEFIIKR